MARRILALLVLATVGAVGVVWWRWHRPAAESLPASYATGAKKQKYQCSMHPQIVSDKPENCPICGMKLTPVEEGPAQVAAGGERKIVGYRHPMKPDVVSPTPAKDEMGMDYVPIYEEASPVPGADVPGHAPFSLSTARQQLIGVRRAKVEYRPLTVAIRAIGTVAYDPELYQAIVEYRQALRARAQRVQSALPEAQSGADGLGRAAAVEQPQKGLSEAPTGGRVR